MTRADWRQEVMLALVKRKRGVTWLAQELKCSRAWIYNVFTGTAPEEAREKWTKEINNLLGIKGEIEDEEN